MNSDLNKEVELSDIVEQLVRSIKSGNININPDDSNNENNDNPKKHAINFIKLANKYMYHSNRIDLTNPETKILKEINNLEPKQITDIIRFIASSNKDGVTFIKGLWKDQIAPKEKIQDDFCGLVGEDILYSTLDSKVYSWILAITGHAANGHGAFVDENGYKLYFPNTTVNHILNAISDYGDVNKISPKFSIKKPDYFQPTVFRKRVQKDIDKLMRFIGKYFEDPLKNKYMTISKGKNLLGLKFNETYNIDMLEFLRGFMLSGWMDVDYLRDEGFKKYLFEMGNGITIAGNISETSKYVSSLKELSKRNYPYSRLLQLLDPDKMISVFSELKMIKKIKKLDFAGIERRNGGKLSWDLIKENYGLDIFKAVGEWENIYIRRKLGKGISDDIALTLAGYMPDTFRGKDYIPSKMAVNSRIIGAVIGDRLDTNEKLSNIIFDHGQDSTSAQYANYRFKKLCESRVYRKNNHIKDGLKSYDLVSFPIMIDYSILSSNIDYIIHSSMRRFGKEQEGTCMIEQLLLYANETSKRFSKDKFNSNRAYASSELPEGMLKSKKMVDIRVGFHEVPIEKYKNRVDQGIALLLPPERRKKNLVAYFSGLS